MFVILRISLFLRNSIKIFVRNTTCDLIYTLDNHLNRKENIFGGIEKEQNLYEVQRYVKGLDKNLIKNVEFFDLYVAKESWVMNYKKGGGQPWHTHAGNIISAVYIIQANAELDTKLYFKSPVTDMMNPFNSNMNPYNKGYDVNEYNNEQVAYPSTPGVLYTFRSHLEHSITQKVTDTKRVILALNYNRT